MQNNNGILWLGVGVGELKGKEFPIGDVILSAKISNVTKFEAWENDF